MTSSVKSCTLNPVPTFLREFIDLLLVAAVSDDYGECITLGRQIAREKHAIVGLSLRL